MNQKKIISLLLLLVLVSAVPAAAEETKTLSKEKVIKLGLENSKEITKLRAEIKSAQAKLSEAGGGFLPTVDLKANYTRLDEKPTSSLYLFNPDGTIKIDPETMRPKTKEIEVGSKDNYSVELSLQQPLYLGGKLWSGWNQAKKGLAIAELELEQKRKEVIYQVLEQYYNLLKAEKMLEVAQQRVEQAQNFVEVAEANYEVGMFTKTDLLQAKVNHTRAQQGVLQAKNRLQMAKLALKNELDIQDKTKLSLKEELTQEEVKQLPAEEAYQYALEHRAQIELLNLQEENLKLNLERAKKDKWLPNLNLMGNYQQQGTDWDSLQDAEGDWQVMVTASYNLFSGGRKEAKVKQVASQLDKFAASKEQAKEGIKLEVQQTLLSVDEAQQRIELTKLNLEKAEENLEQVELKYEEGMVTTSDILEAQTTLGEVKTDYYQAVYDYNLAAAKLKKVLGKSIAVKEGTK